MDDINIVEWATLVGVLVTLLGVGFKIVSDWTIPKWKYRHPFDIECEDQAVFYTYINQTTYDCAERFKFMLTFKRSIAFNGFWPEFAQDKKLGYGDSLINIHAVFDQGKETEWGLNTHHVFHKGDVLNLEIIVMGNFEAASLWERFFRVRMSSDDNRSIKTAPVYIRSSPVQAEVHELDQYKKR